MFTYLRSGTQPSVSITELDKDNSFCFSPFLSWDQRTETKKLHPGFHPREFLIGRVAVAGQDFLSNVLQEKNLEEPEGIGSTRKSLMEAMLQHTSEVGPQQPLFSGRGGNRPLRGEPMRIRDDGTLWGTSPEIFRESIGGSMNNPFHYIYHRSGNHDASAHGGEPFFPAIAVFDQELLTETTGNVIDKTSWKVRHGSPLGAVASMYYFDPQHFTLDKY